MAQYMPPTDQQLPPATSRPRATSSASSYRYHPDNPRNAHPPTPQASAPMPIPSHVQAGAPAFAGQPIIGTAPVANSAYFGTPPGQPYGQTPPAYGTSPGYFGTSPSGVYPQTQLHPGYPGMPNSGPPTSHSQPYTPGAAPNPNYSGPPNVDADGFMRPPHDARRASASSTHSRRSGRSGHSHHSHGRRDSHHQARRRHSEDSYEDDELTREERRERDRRHSTGGDSKPAKRTKEHRPTLGDTVYSFFGVIKGALGPRDKY